MSPRFARTPALLALLALLVPVSALTAPTEPPQPDSASREVLTLEETAALLRVAPDSVAELAEAGELPGRKLGGAWRFHRAAVLDWLAGRVVRDGGAHDDGMLARVRARGMQGGPPDRPPTAKEPSSDAQPGEEQETYGEAPETPTAEEISLRGERIILDPGEITLELDLSYAKSDELELEVSPVASLATQELVASALQGHAESDAFRSSFTLRYGLPSDFEAIASIPYSYRELTHRLETPGGGVETLDRDPDWELGSPSFQLRRTVLGEDVARPELNLALLGIVPHRNESWGTGLGLTLTKSLDPAVLFAGVNYVHRFVRDLEHLDSLEPDDQVNAFLGYAFAVNETLSFSSRLDAIFASHTSYDADVPGIDEVVLPSQEALRLELSMTSLLSPRLFVEPFVNFNLTGVGSDAEVGVRVPYTFRIPPLRW